MSLKHNAEYKARSPKWIKGFCSLALIASICIQDYTPEENSKSNIANASNLPVIDTQFTCSVDGKESGDSDSTDISPKDTNIDMKKFKKVYEKNAKGGAFDGKTEMIIKVADEAKVPPLLMAAIVAHESQWGKAPNATKQKNPMSVMGSATIHDTQYDTVEEGLKAGAKNLYSGYIKEGLDTPKKIQPKYAPTENATNDPEGSNNNWLPTVESIMKSLGGESDIKSSSTSSKDDKDDDKESEGASSADSSNDTATTNPCEEEEDKGKSSDDAGTAKGGDSVKANGKSGKKIAGQWTYDEIPSKYKKYIKIPKFDEKFLDKPGNNFANTGFIGECTELTWAYMNQMHGQGQPADDGSITNGERVHEVYKAKGAKTTHNPTVGYGFSSKPPFALASIPGIGHTGVVAGVLPDGKFIIAQYNVPPDPAPSRTVLYSVIDGVPEDAGDNLIFFSGINGHTKVKGMK